MDPIQQFNLERIERVKKQGEDLKFCNLGKDWNFTNNPQTALELFLANDNRFIIDMTIDNKIIISSSPRGYLKKISD